MERRAFLRNCLATPAALAAARFGFAANGETGVGGWRSFDVVTEIEVVDPIGPTQLWIPLPDAARADYQRRLTLAWDAPKSARVSIESIPGYDVQLLHVRWADARAVAPVSVRCGVATRDRHVDVERPAPGLVLRPRALKPWLAPTRLLPTDGIVRRTAEAVVAGRSGEVERARAVYSWVVENTNRDPRAQGCGVGDVGAMLESGFLGGKCADINGLFVAMARSIGIPARDAYGVRIADSRRGYKSLGRSGDITRAQHCRAEFYAAGLGWVPVDPADVRKVILEEPPGNLDLGNPRVEAARDFLFGNWEMNWIAFNHGHDVALPGARQKPLPFLMYPQGESGDKRLDPLDAQGFRYRMTSTERMA
jgi:transglutaminase-like putative cysteine protease